MDLRVEDKTSPLYGTRLFHSVDFWVDSSKVWIDNTKGPGASCHVFTYYKQVASEASEMVTGLGKMVISRYDKNLAAAMFNIDHFKGNSGYRWSEEKGRFSTPLDRQMKQNYRYDNNLQAVNILRDLEKEEKTKSDNEDKTEDKAMTIVEGHQEKMAKKKQVVSSNMSNDNVTNSMNQDDKSESSLTTIGKEIRDKQLAIMLQKREDTDLDSIDDTSVVRKKVHQVDMDDDRSVASSLTDISNEELSGASDYMTDFSISTGGSVSSGFSSTISSTHSTEIAKLIESIAASSETTMTDKELYQAVHNFQLRKFNKKNQMVTAELEKYIARRGDKEKHTSKLQTPSNSENNVKTVNPVSSKTHNVEKNEEQIENVKSAGAVTTSLGSSENNHSSSVDRVLGITVALTQDNSIELMQGSKDPSTSANSSSTKQTSLVDRTIEILQGSKERPTSVESSNNDQVGVVKSNNGDGSSNEKTIAQESDDKASASTDKDEEASAIDNKQDPGSSATADNDTPEDTQVNKGKTSRVCNNVQDGSNLSSQFDQPKTNAQKGNPTSDCTVEEDSKQVDEDTSIVNETQSQKGNQTTFRQSRKSIPHESRRQSERLQLMNKSRRSQLVTQASGVKTGNLN